MTRTSLVALTIFTFMAMSCLAQDISTSYNPVFNGNPRTILQTEQYVLMQALVHGISGPAFFMYDNQNQIAKNVLNSSCSQIYARSSKHVYCFSPENTFYRLEYNDGSITYESSYKCDIDYCSDEDWYEVAHSSADGIMLKFCQGNLTGIYDAVIFDTHEKVCRNISGPNIYAPIPSKEGVWTVGH